MLYIYHVAIFSSLTIKITYIYTTAVHVYTIVPLQKHPDVTVALCIPECYNE